jgi:hypothetical protein
MATTCQSLFVDLSGAASVHVSAPATHHCLSGNLLCKDSKETSTFDAEIWRLFTTRRIHYKGVDRHARARVL